MTVHRKIMLLGNVGVGKTSIAKRLVFRTFGSGNYKGTVGSDVYQYIVEPSPLDVPFVFSIWDTDGNYGETLFQSVYIRGAQAALIVGDLKRPKTLSSMVELARAFEANLPGRYACCVLNKADLLGEGEAPEIPEELTASGLPYIITSAATGDNIARTFHDAAATIARRGL